MRALDPPLFALIPPQIIAAANLILACLAPRGRGPSNGFSRNHAQEDIDEAIAAVIQSYPIDEKRIILTGFSMGGYGVYRTFYEHPERYRALAVFSGMPFFRNFSSPGEDAPDFLEERYLGKFKGMPVFVFHGREDWNCPFGVTQELIGNLERVGAKVELVTEEGAGHQRPSPETLSRYHEWLKSVTGPNRINENEYVLNSVAAGLCPVSKQATTADSATGIG